MKSLSSCGTRLRYLNRKLVIVDKVSDLNTFHFALFTHGASPTGLNSTSILVCSLDGAWRASLVRVVPAVPSVMSQRCRLRHWISGYIGRKCVFGLIPSPLPFLRPKTETHIFFSVTFKKILSFLEGSFFIYWDKLWGGALESRPIGQPALMYRFILFFATGLILALADHFEEELLVKDFDNGFSGLHFNFVTLKTTGGGNDWNCSSLWIQITISTYSRSLYIP